MIGWTRRAGSRPPAGEPRTRIRFAVPPYATLLRGLRCTTGATVPCEAHKAGLSHMAFRGRGRQHLPASGRPPPRKGEGAGEGSGYARPYPQSRHSSGKATAIQTRRWSRRHHRQPPPCPFSGVYAAPQGPRSPAKPFLGEGTPAARLCMFATFGGAVRQSSGVATLTHAPVAKNGWRKPYATALPHKGEGGKNGAAAPPSPLVGFAGDRHASGEGDATTSISTSATSAISW